MSNLQISARVQAIKPSATLGMAQAARDLADQGVDVVVLSAGEPDFTTPQIISDVAKKSIDEGKTHYVPVRGTKNLVAAMKEKFLREQKVSYAADEVLCTVGAKSAILLALNALVNEGDEVIIFAPFWVSYLEQIRLVSGIPVVVNCLSENGFMPTAEDLAKAITKKTKAIILNSPNNPTGAVITKQQLEAIAQVLHGTNIWLISDEIYEKLLFDNHQHYSPAAVSDDMRDRSIVISGASKAYAMTGWRVGVVAGNKFIIDAMVNLQGQNTTCLPEFIQDAAAFAFKENDAVQREIAAMVSAYQERRDFALDLFSQMPQVKTFKPQGAFYLWVDFSSYIGKTFGVEKISDDLELAIRMLKEAHVASVPGTPFGGPGFLRFSIASSKKSIEKAADRITKWLKDKS